MAMSGSTSSSSAIRPRNRRLISIDDPYTDDAESSESALTTSLQPQSFAGSPAHSRGVSPIPSKHPSRSTTAPVTGRSGSANGARSVKGWGTADMQSSPGAFATGLWESSWSSIQGLASTVLGNDTQPGRKDKPNGFLRSGRMLKPLAPSFQRTSSGALVTEWGPTAPEKQIAEGTKEERRKMVEVKKREALLSADGQILSDQLGRVKRKGSNDHVSASVPPEQREQEALVYVHHVAKEDTLAGVTIKYCCQPGVFRKVNRLWPNDSIQTKRTVLLPVEACGVKGKPVSEIENLKLLESEALDDTTPTASRPPFSDFEYAQRQMDELSVTSSVANGCQDYQHESWVRIEGFPAPVEIGRVSSQSLGFFPTARRKSNAFSDRETPSVSLDLPRITSSRGSPTSRQSRKRSSSGSYFIQHLQGPGGVGTLGKDVRNPGPPQDKLNRMFAHHLPNVGPRDSFESTASTSSTGIENVGGAIEGWVRKMASKAATIIETNPSQSTFTGDLIELDDSFDSALLEGDGSAQLERPETSTSSKGKGSARVDQEALLRERFPPRGRMFSDESRKNKGG